MFFAAHVICTPPFIWAFATFSFYFQCCVYSCAVPVLVALLDVQKAFDTVWHNYSLFHKLYSYCIKDDTWWILPVLHWWGLAKTCDLKTLEVGAGAEQTWQ